MKLPDFYVFPDFISIKNRMGIPQNKYGNIIAKVDASRLTELELDKLTSSAGLDIASEDLRILADGTLAYKSSRVIVYIRDISTDWRDRDVRPKFHLANCATLESMRANNRFNRYVVSQNTDGKFKLNYVEYGKVKEHMTELSVCQHCLSHLHFDEFSFGMSKNERVSIVNTFKLERFFELYPRSLHSSTPQYNSDNAPINDYSDDWDALSLKLRRSVGWKCQKPHCGIDLSATEKRQFLQVHHKDGQKYNNHSDNLEILCIECHSNEPNHSHMKAAPDFKRFIRMKYNLY